MQLLVCFSFVAALLFLDSTTAHAGFGDKAAQAVKAAEDAKKKADEEAARTAAEETKKREELAAKTCPEDAKALHAKIQGLNSKIQELYTISYIKSSSTGKANNPLPTNWAYCGSTDPVANSAKAVSAINFDVSTPEKCKATKDACDALWARYEKGCSEFLKR